jgi:hypothetical protein
VRKLTKAAAKRDYGYQGQKLPSHVREGIKQMYLVEPNKSLIARTFGVNLSTVYRILGKEDPEVVREARQEAMARLASKASKHAEAIIDNLEVPEDASYLQKMTGFGIAVDKVEKLDKRLDEKQKDARVESGEIMALPDDIESITGLIRNDLRGLSVLLGIQFAGLPQSRAVDAEVVEEQAEEVLKLSDLDVGALDEQEDRHTDADGPGPRADDADGRAGD